VAPLLPLLVAMGALAVTVRRLVSPWAFALAHRDLLCGHSVRNQFVPLRIDHHGWQLAMLAVAVMALTDPKRARGGAIARRRHRAVAQHRPRDAALPRARRRGGGADVGARPRRQARRLAAYGASLAGGCALGYLLFASNANRAPVCDALSPVWLSAMVGGGASASPVACCRRAGLVRFGAAAAGGLLGAASTRSPGRTASAGWRARRSSTGCGSATCARRGRSGARLAHRAWHRTLPADRASSATR
jgi:hypothetical protein